MAGLVSYGSSDEEEVYEESAQPEAENIAPQFTAPNGTTAGERNTSSHQEPFDLISEAEINGIPRIAEPKPDLEAPLVGPALPIAEMPDELQLHEDQSMEPQSPYTAKRALLRDLTLPTLPSYDIPASPPGSPMESTNAKFKHFLQLKKKAVHFNEKLAKSSALKNPSLMQKLMDFSDIDEAGQYSTVLPEELWSPRTFPDYAYKEELAKTQQRLLKNKDDEKLRRRESVDFVPATSAAEPLSRSGTPGFGGRSSHKSIAERVMERGSSSSPQVQGTKRKSRFDS